MNRKALSLFALTLMIFTLPLSALAFHSGPASDLAINPEMIAFRNYSVGRSDRLAANPELAVLARYRGGSVDKWAVNPELALLARFSGSGTDELAINPELSAARGFGVPDSRGLAADSARWAAMAAYYGSGFVAANPELIFARSYSDVSNNPELLSLQKFDICGC